MISLVLPVYNEAAGLVQFHTALLSTLEAAGIVDVELIYVDDGSVDGSGEILEVLAGREPRVRVLSLSRNFGHQVAISAGLDHADGDAVIIMDTDLQDPPEVAVRLIERWREGFDVVYAQRRVRDEGLFKRTSAHVFYWALDRVSEVEIPRNVGDFRLADRRVVQEIRRFAEHDRYMRGLFSYVGFRQTAVPFDRPGRASGDSGYPLSRMMKLAADGVFGFSAAPLRLVRDVGFLVAALAIVGALWIFVGKLVDPASSVPGWAFIVVCLLFASGVQISMISVVGSYVARIHTQTKGRPLYVVASDSRAARPVRGEQT